MKKAIKEEKTCPNCKHSMVRGTKMSFSWCPWECLLADDSSCYKTRQDSCDKFEAKG